MKVVVEDVIGRAKTLYSNGLCCSESIIVAFAETVKVDNPNTLMKASSGLCGGLGYGELCGALSASACGLGLYFGRYDIENAPKIKCSMLSKELAAAFKDKFGSCRCDDLTAGMEKGSTQQREKCTKIIEESVKIAARIINKN